MNIPLDLKYSKTHEWVRIKGNEATVGITDFAQKELGDIVYIELPKMGQKLKAEDPCAVVESVKAASDIYAPISGTVIRMNDALEKDTSLVNKDPYHLGWFFTVELNSPDETERLLSPKDYQNLISTEA